ncbi:putative hydrolase YxeP [Clostridium sp. N3C]|uniref:M20 metallopeptidase family protein n=1 Tax=Clostridium sp. N3C TaxID=1776758 RepID=UPI00092DFAD1|nr:M20 family metallopeptidase [Clostridium sp. N3C]SCN23292.1 putative hydrolase YxeP [Clostridium sp. N3C]
MNLKELIINRLEEFKDIRRTLHENAELSNQEYKTSKIIQNYLSSIGLTYQTIANTGVVSVLNQGTECIGIRADIDALPINGVFHGCGHDYHMAILLGVAAILKELNIDKCIKFIFQPAEEDGGGALPMIKEGVLENPKVTRMIGYHVWPGLELGSIEATSGPSMGSVDDFKILFKGKGGHGAMPDLCINPLKPAVEFTYTMQNYKTSLASTPYVLNLTSINCGNAPNVVADEALVMGTLRTFDDNLRKHLKEEISKTASDFAQKYGCTHSVKFLDEYPPLINDDRVSKEFINITSELLGKEKVKPLIPTYAGEDFSYFAKAVPSVHFRLGIKGDGLGELPLHSSNFTAHEDAIFYGIYIICNYILSLK